MIRVWVDVQGSGRLSGFRYMIRVQVDDLGSGRGSEFR